MGKWLRGCASYYVLWRETAGASWVAFRWDQSTTVGIVREMCHTKEIHSAVLEKFLFERIYHAEIKRKWKKKPFKN